MTKEQLRELIVEKQRPACKGEPGPHAVANHLASFQHEIFESDNERDQQGICGIFGYEDIESLRKDAADLVTSLSEELKPEDWQIYFKRRKNLLQRG